MSESLYTRLLRYRFNFFPAYRGTGGRITYIGVVLVILAGFPQDGADEGEKRGEPDRWRTSHPHRVFQMVPLVTDRIPISGWAPRNPGTAAFDLHT